MNNFNTRLLIGAISLLGSDGQYSYAKGSKFFTNVSSFQLKRFLDGDWDENEELKLLIKSKDANYSSGWLIIDDTLIEKPYSKEIEGVYWQYSSKVNDFERGLNLTVLLWTNGKTQVPIAYMVYEKGENGKAFETKNAFALRAIEYAQGLDINPKFIAFDSKYASSELLNRINDFKWTYYTQLPRNRVFGGEQLSKQEFHLQVKTGKLNGVAHIVSVIKHCGRFYATNATGNNVSRQQILKSYRPRWAIEEYFRVLKQLCHLKECKSRKIKQQRRYILVVMRAYMLLSHMGKSTIYEAKLHFQQKFMGRKINGDKALRLLTA